jgi:hypothetical protein
MFKQLKLDVWSTAIDTVAAVPPSGTLGYAAFVQIAVSLFSLGAARTRRLAGNYRRNHASHSRA